MCSPKNTFSFLLYFKIKTPAITNRVIASSFIIKIKQHLIHIKLSKNMRKRGYATNPLCACERKRVRYLIRTTVDSSGMFPLGACFYLSRLRIYSCIINSCEFSVRTFYKLNDNCTLNRVVLFVECEVACNVVAVCSFESCAN